MNSELVVVSPEQQEVISVRGFETQAEKLVIVTAVDAQVVSNLNTELAVRIDQVKSVYNDLIEPAQLIKEKAGKYCNPALEDMTRARDIQRTKLGVWQQNEQARVAKARAEQEAKEREVRQRSEKEAALKQAKADAIVSERRREAERAEERRVEAEKAGNAAAIRKAMQDKIKAEQGAFKAQEDAQHEVNRIHMETAAQIHTPINVTKIDGVTMRANWVARPTSFDEDDSKLALINAIASGDKPELIVFLKLNMPAINKMAKAMKNNLVIPGFKAVNEPITTGARRKA
jgi:hypothetical protein